MTHQPAQMVMKENAPAAFWRCRAVLALPLDVCQYTPDNMAKVIVNVPRMVTKHIFVRKARMVKRKHMKPMESMKKP